MFGLGKWFRKTPDLGALRALARQMGRDRGLTLESLTVQNQQVIAVFGVDPEHAGVAEPLRQEIAFDLREASGGLHTQVILTAERVRAETVHHGLPAGGHASPVAPVRTDRKLAQGVKFLVAVASGKGGVGKSTVAANLAVALSQAGQKVGLLDADIHGPSVPLLMGTRMDRPQQNADSLIEPLVAHGVKVMSIGFFADPSAPVVWRGPMVQGAIVQMLRDVDWTGTDVLVIDLPPGTGDAQLTLAQKAPLSGAVIVSTPQDLALADARKGLFMFQQVNVPVLGIVENMATFVCPHCGTASDIFGHGGARAEAEKLGVPFLGEVPLTMAIRAASDAGVPVTVSDPEGEIAKIYRQIAAGVLQQLGAEKAA